jgi:hypothetical protein
LFRTKSKKPNVSVKLSKILFLSQLWRTFGTSPRDFAPQNLEANKQSSRTCNESIENKRESSVWIKLTYRKIIKIGFKSGCSEIFTKFTVFKRIADMSIKSHLQDVRESLPAGVKLVAVSKMHTPAQIKEAYAAGQRIFGESRPQELTAKQAVLPKDIEWHMIGHLQTNKVKLIVPFVALIHSVDSERLVEAINDEAAKVGRVVDILLEIHVADEESKSGWEYDTVLKYVQSGAFRSLEHVRVRGVMGVATYTDNEFRVRLDFELLQQYKNDLSAYFGPEFDTLSMGMSDDYPLALEYGSTMVRIGSLIFGHRDPNAKTFDTLLQ